MVEEVPMEPDARKERMSTEGGDARKERMSSEGKSLHADEERLAELQEEADRTAAVLEEAIPLLAHAEELEGLRLIQVQDLSLIHI